MSQEHQEEQAALFALDLLSPEERDAFAAEIGRAPSLQSLAHEFREVSCNLAYRAPSLTPPPELKSRILASLNSPEHHGTVVQPSQLNFRSILPWATAAGLALAAVWLTQLHLSRQAEVELLRSQNALVELSLQASRQQLEAERLLAKQQLASLERQVASQEKEVARLTADLKSQADLANLKISALASLLKQSPEASAVAVWNPARQEGVLAVASLPALAPDQDYQLWVVDPQYPNPVDGGVFAVEAQTGAARLTFKARVPIGTVKAFAVTLERKGGVPKAEGPFVLMGR